MRNRIAPPHRAGSYALILLSITTLVGLGSAPATAQKPTILRDVRIDALVTDAKGNAVVGLGKHDFEVRENGKAIELTGVTFYGDRQAGGESAPSGDRYFIVFFDQHLTPPHQLAKQLDAGQRLRDWVHGQLQPNDYVAVANYDSRLKIQQDFSRDRQRIDEAIGNALLGKPQESSAGSGGGPSLLANLPKGDAMRDQTTNIYDALKVLGKAAAPITGRKNLLLFSTGIEHIMDKLSPTDPVYYPPMVNALNDGAVAVYAIDMPPRRALNAVNDTLSQLASDTGGDYFFNFVTVTTPLDQVMQRTNGYYLLSYSSGHPEGKSGFQQVQVRVKDPESTVKVRKGYTFGSGR